jgi:hypothetical protein
VIDHRVADNLRAQVEEETQLSATVQKDADSAQRQLDAAVQVYDELQDSIREQTSAGNRIGSILKTKEKQRALLTDFVSLLQCFMTWHCIVNGMTATAICKLTDSESDSDSV